MCGGMIVPTKNTQQVLFPPSDGCLSLQPGAFGAMEMTVQISTSLPKQPAVQEISSSNYYFMAANLISIK